MKIAGAARHESWRMAQPFVIAGHTYHDADVIVVDVEADGSRGWGEGTPTFYYGETINSSLAAARAMLERQIQASGIVGQGRPRLAIIPYISTY